MKQTFIIKENHPHLLLFFAGWGMDERPFIMYHPKRCDLMICYDYRSLTFDETLLKGYENITLVAWSMGVWAASQAMKQCLVSRSIAINGTPYPIDEVRGIAPGIFEGTLQGLNERGLQKFQRRMCGSAAEYRAFCEVAPQRPVEELKEELAAIRTQYRLSEPSVYPWTRAIIGRGDRIFLPENQKRAWEASATVIEEADAAHYQRELFFIHLAV